MNSDPDLQICAWVKIGDTSEIDYEVAGDGRVEFSIGGCDEFLLVTSEYGLQNFVAYANEALQAVREAIDRRDDEGYTSSVDPA